MLLLTIILPIILHWWLCYISFLTIRKYGHLLVCWILLNLGWILLLIVLGIAGETGIVQVSTSMIVWGISIAFNFTTSYLYSNRVDR